MLLLPFLRYKKKQKRHNLKYKLIFIKKSLSERKLCGKYLFIISRNKNFCFVLKFKSKKLCTAECTLKIDNSFKKLISKKYLIDSKRNKKILRNCEVMIKKPFKNSVMKIIKLSNQQSTTNDDSLLNEAFTCDICEERFDNLGKLQKHCDIFHELESEEEESDNEDVEMTIDTNESTKSKNNVKNEENEVIVSICRTINKISFDL